MLLFIIQRKKLVFCYYIQQKFPVSFTLHILKANFDLRTRWHLENDALLCRQDLQLVPRVSVYYANQQALRSRGQRRPGGLWRSQDQGHCALVVAACGSEFL